MAVDCLRFLETKQGPSRSSDWASSQVPPCPPTDTIGIVPTQSHTEQYTHPDESLTLYIEAQNFKYTGYIKEIMPTAPAAISNLSWQRRESAR